MAFVYLTLVVREPIVLPGPQPVPPALLANTVEVLLVHAAIVLLATTAAQEVRQVHRAMELALLVLIVLRAPRAVPHVLLANTVRRLPVHVVIVMQATMGLALA